VIKQRKKGVNLHSSCKHHSAQWHSGQADTSSGFQVWDLRQCHYTSDWHGWWQWASHQASLRLSFPVCKWER